MCLGWGFAIGDSLAQVSCFPEAGSKLRAEGLQVGREDPHGICEAVNLLPEDHPPKGGPGAPPDAAGDLRKRCVIHYYRCRAAAMPTML